jgi:hypothetical protein
LSRTSQTSSGVATWTSKKRSSPMTRPAFSRSQKGEMTGPARSSRPREKASHLGGPSDVFRPVSLGERQVTIQTEPEVVAVDDVDVTARLVQAPLGLLGDRGLAGARETGGPDGDGPLAQEPLAITGRDPTRFARDIRGSRRGVGHRASEVLLGHPVDQHPGTDRVVGDVTDESIDAIKAVVNRTSILPLGGSCRSAPRDSPAVSLSVVMAVYNECYLVAESVARVLAVGSALITMIRLEQQQCLAGA